MNFEFKSSIWRISLEFKLQGAINLFEPDCSWVSMNDYAEFRESNFNSMRRFPVMQCFFSMMFAIIYIAYIFSYGANHMPYILIRLGKVITTGISCLRSHFTQCCTEIWEVPFGFIMELFDWITGWYNPGIIQMRKGNQSGQLSLNYMINYTISYGMQHIT